MRAESNELLFIGTFFIFTLLYFRRWKIKTSKNAFCIFLFDFETTIFLHGSVAKKQIKIIIHIRTRQEGRGSNYKLSS